MDQLLTRYAHRNNRGRSTDCRSARNEAILGCSSANVIRLKTAVESTTRHETKAR